MSETRVCKRCGAVKPVTEFHRQLKAYTSKCKPCMAEYVRERYVADPDATRAETRRRYLTSPEKFKRASHRWYAKAHEATSGATVSGEWTESEDEILADDLTGPEVAAKLSRTISSVLCRREWLKNADQVQGRWVRANHEARAATLPGATNWGKKWTGPELEMVADYSRTTLDLALALGRTAKSIEGQRRLLRIDPRKDRLAGVSGTPKVVTPALRVAS